MSVEPGHRGPYAPYSPGAAPLELAESLAEAWRLHARLLAIARAADPGPARDSGEIEAEAYRLALLPLDALLAPHRPPPEPGVAARARDRLAGLVAQGRGLEQRLRQRRRAGFTVFDRPGLAPRTPHP